MKRNRIKLFGLIGIFLILSSVIVALFLNKNTTYENNKIAYNEEEAKAYVIDGYIDSNSGLSIPMCEYTYGHYVNTYMPTSQVEYGICPKCSYDKAKKQKYRYECVCKTKNIVKSIEGENINCERCYAGLFVYNNIIFYLPYSGEYFHELTSKYTVEYNGNGATGGSTASSSHTYGTAQALTSNGFTRQYNVTFNHNYSGSSNTTKTATYSFKNWNTQANGGGTSYANGASVNNLAESGTVTLYAQWNSGSVSYTPSRTGYSFGGWYTSSACSGSRVDSNGTYTPTAGTTLYAKWVPNTYTVAYNGNGATGGSTASSSHSYGTAKNLTSNGFTRQYNVTFNHNYSGSSNTSKTATYSFKNWNTQANGGGTSYANGASVNNLIASGTFNLYAQWNAASVSYTPSRTGYTFGGWYTNSSCSGNRVDSNGTYTPTAGTTLYAKWTANTYTVTYNGNGNTGGSTASSSHTYDTAKALTANGFIRQYNVTFNHNYTESTNTTKTATYSFKNWNTQANGSGTSYSNGASVNNLVTSGNFNLYAQWNTASVNYTPSRTGYTFGGWFTNPSCTGNRVDNNGTYTPTAGTTLYAKWTANTYTVTYDGNGATEGSTANSSHTYDEAKNLTENGYIRKYQVTYNHNYEGSTDTQRTATYSFKNWNTQADGSGDTYTNSQSVNNLTTSGTFNLYAQWNSDSVDYRPERTGYTFRGWYREKECINEVIGTIDTTYTPQEDITLYAKWDINYYNYTVNYLEKGTDKVLQEQKIDGSKTYGTQILGKDEKIDIKGYRYLNSNDITLSEQEQNNVINIYYVKSQYKYKVEYYYNDKKDESKTDEFIATYEDVIRTCAFKHVEGYTLERVDNLPLLITEKVKENIIKVYYITDDESKKTISYAVEYYKGGENQETDRQEETKTVQTLEPDKLEVKKEEINTENKYYGYKLEKTEPSPIPDEINSGETIKVYYVIDEENTKDVSYTIEYYKNGKLEETEEKRGTVQVLEPERLEVDKEAIRTKYKGYKIDETTASLPDKANNGQVIKVNYIIDEKQTKEIGYKVEYYKDGEKVEKDTQEINKTVQVLEEDRLEVDKTKVNTENKYIAYKLEKIVVNNEDKDQLPETVDNKTIIKVYYIRDEEKTGYTIEYYYDNEKDESKTEEIEVEKDAVITKEDLTEKIERNKKEGYKLLIALNIPLKTSYELKNNVIKVYYVAIEIDPENPDNPDGKHKTGYSIEYYYNEVRDNTRTEAVEVAENTIISKEDITDKIEANKKEGYKLLTVLNTPLTIERDIEKNVIKVYYVAVETDPENPDGKHKTGYSIEYYYNEVRDNTRTEAVEVTENTIISKEDITDKIEANKKEGYKLLTVLNTPLTIERDIEENVIKVYYVAIETDPENPDNPDGKRKTGYSIEYYYNNKKDNRKSEAIETEKDIIVTQEDIANKVEANKKEGYKLFTVLNTPLKIEENIENNVIKVYYVTIETDPENPDNPDGKYKTGYSIEYYYNEVRDNTRTEAVEAKENAVIAENNITEKIEANKKDGYKLLTVLNTPLTIEENIEQNVIKVYYTKIETDPENPDNPDGKHKTGYSIEYYYDNKKDNRKSEAVETEKDIVVNKEDITDKVEANKKEGYKLLAILNTPLKIEENIENNVIKVYYVTIETDPENPDNPEGKHKTGYSIEYYYDNKKDNRKSEAVELPKDTIVTKEDITAKVEANKKEGYKLLTVLNTPLTIEENIKNNVIKVYYTKIETDSENPDNPDGKHKTGYSIEYYYNEVKDNTKTEAVETEENAVITENDITAKIEANKKDGYKLLTVLNTPLTIEEDIEQNVIKVYYVTIETDPENPDNPEGKHKTGYSIEYYYDNKKDNRKSEAIEVPKDTIVTKEDITAKIEINKKDGYKLLTVLNTPLRIEENIEQNVIKVYYTKIEIDPENPDNPEGKHKTGYSIEYYYDELKDNTRTEAVEAEENAVITENDITDKIEANKKDGYKLLTVLNTPLTIEEDIEQNVIKVYYTKIETDPENPDNPEGKHKTGYSIEYYYDGVKDNRKSEAVEMPKDIIVNKEDITAKVEANKKEGYKLLAILNTPLQIEENIENNVIKVYYTKIEIDPEEPDNPEGKHKTGYSIEYYYNGIKNNRLTDMVEDEAGKIIEQVDINSYIEKNKREDTLEIGVIGVPLEIDENVYNNVIKVYYVVTPTKEDRKEYTIEYYYEEDEEKNAQEKVSAIRGEVITKEKLKEKAENRVIDGYEFSRVESVPLVISQNIEENIVKVYYVKRTDLSYKVEYYYDGKQDESKTVEVENQKFKDVIDEYEDKNITGYKLESTENVPLTIGADISKNVMKIYYTKRSDLNYTVNYLEKETNKVLQEPKIVEDQTFEDVINTADEIIEIDGYNHDSNDKETLTIKAEENVINIYYTKKNDLSYTVNYLEKETEKILVDPKVVENKTFEDIIVAETEKINIDGYNYDSSDKETITIGTGENIINIYYTKRADLSYIVNYLEKETDRVLQEQKIVDNQTFGTTIDTTTEKIAINGFKFDSIDKDELEITTGENVINIYYTKVTGLSYTVKYEEKGTNRILKEPKTVEGQTFEDEILAKDEIIDIDGFNYNSSDKEKIVIGTATNEMTLYYTKKTDLSYKVTYTDKATGEEIHPSKVVENNTYEDIVKAKDEVIDIDGYTVEDPGEAEITIGTSENVIDIKYNKRTDLSYKVNYLEKGTDKVIKDQKVVNNQTFKAEITSSTEIEEIYGYNYDSISSDELEITTKENIINIYYTKKDTKVTVHYYEEGTTNKLSNDVTINGKVFDEYETESANDIPSKYELIEEPENSTGEMLEEEIVVTYYYRKKATQVIVHYYEEGTTNKLSENVIINGRVDDSYTTTAATDVPIKYELVAEPNNKNGNMTEETIEVTYFYRVRDTQLIIKYLEKDTNLELAREERQNGKVEEDYITDAKQIDNYTLVGNSGNTTGKLTIDPITVTFYYLQNTKVTVNHIDKNTGEKLEVVTKEGLVGDSYTSSSRNFENYVLVERPEQENVTMAKNEIVLNYYYVHVSAGLVEKHVDTITGDILYNEVHQGNEGDPYNIPSKSFNGYDLVQDKLPENSTGTMKINTIEVTYYYIYRSKVTVEYIDRATGEKLTEDIVTNGHEDDSYKAERKEFKDYELVQEPTNEEGKMTKEPITVTYIYAHHSEGVKVEYKDIITGEVLVGKEIEGNEGDPYKTEPENIPGYDLVKEKLPENAESDMKIEVTVVNYYYIKKTNVTVKYIDKVTGKEIAEQEVINGHETDKYVTESKEITEYDLIEQTENCDGTMTKDPIEVIYYYARPAEVIINYIDIDTNKEIVKEEIIKGHEGDSYKAEEKEMKYYYIVKENYPANKEGTMQVSVVGDKVDNKTYVNYYYKQMKFSLKVDKELSGVSVNGQTTGLNGNFGKIEIHRKELGSAKVQIHYTIKVHNNGELAGKATILEKLPAGTTMSQASNPRWNISSSTATLETDEIKAGETKEYTVILDWVNGEDNVGAKTNTIEVIKTENEAGFETADVDVSGGVANITIAVGTGETTYIIFAGIGLLGLTVAGIVIIKKTKKED